MIDSIRKDGTRLHVDLVSMNAFIHSINLSRTILWHKICLHSCYHKTRSAAILKTERARKNSYRAEGRCQRSSYSTLSKFHRCSRLLSTTYLSANNVMADLDKVNMFCGVLFAQWLDSRGRWVVRIFLAGAGELDDGLGVYGNVGMRTYRSEDRNALYGSHFDAGVGRGD